MRVLAFLRSTLPALVMAGVAGACGPSAPAPEVLRMISFRQEGEVGVFLNETLVFHFDREPERTSLTPESVRVVSEGGEVARGKLELQGSKVLFVPVIPSRTDLADSGLLPGTRYTVVVSGFPNPDGVRARDGAPLLRTRVLSFETIDPAASTVPGPLFVDDTPDRAAPLRLLTQVLGPVDPIVLACDEAIDPRTLFSTDFKLYSTRVTTEEKPEVISVRASLRQNSREGARIELRPTDADDNLRGLVVGQYQLWVQPGESRLRDLAGHAVLPVWLSEPRAGFLTVAKPDPRSGVRSHIEEFLDPRRRSPASVENVAGTAHWADGTVTVRFPAAAGDGSDGVVRLEGDEPARDVNAVDLAVATSTTARLTADGLVVLRSQGRLVVEGNLVRDSEGIQARSQELGHDSYTEWHQWLFGEVRVAWNVPGMEFERGESLSLWLERARELDPDWTVLIAGGDLRVNGVIWTDGPVLLVAGGWIRISGEVRSRPGEYWSLGDVGQSLRSAPAHANLTMDAPDLNPLAVPQTWAVLSAPIRPPHRLVRWLPSRLRLENRGGDVRVSFIGERDLPSGAIEEVGPVDSPVLLEDCEVIRLRLDLTLPSGAVTAPWDPPVVDAVEVSWDTAEEGK